MVWYNYLTAFFAGLFLANSLPHFIHGFKREKYPTPFANPPFKGLSSPSTNILWALINLIVGFLLVLGSDIHKIDIWGIILSFVGIGVICVSGFVFDNKNN